MRRERFVVCKDSSGQEHQVAKEKIQIRLAVSGLMQTDSGILMIRSKTTGLLEMPGGGLEVDETFEAALQREFAEEVGLDIKVGQMFSYAETFYFMRDPDIGYHSLRLFFCVAPQDAKQKPINGRFYIPGEIVPGQVNEVSLGALIKVIPIANET